MSARSNISAFSRVYHIEVSTAVLLSTHPHQVKHLMFNPSAPPGAANIIVLLVGSALIPFAQLSDVTLPPPLRPAQSLGVTPPSRAASSAWKCSSGAPTSRPWRWRAGCSSPSRRRTTGRFSVRMTAVHALLVTRGGGGGGGGGGVADRAGHLAAAGDRALFPRTGRLRQSALQCWSRIRRPAG